MSFSYGNDPRTQSHTRSHFSAPVSPHYRAGLTSALLTPSPYFHSNVWIPADALTLKEVQGDFSQAVLTQSVTLAEFLTLFFRWGG